MEKSTLLAHKGRLVRIRQGGTAIELESFSFATRKGFCDELVSKSTVVAKLRWEIEDAQSVVDHRSGIQAPVVLVSRDSSSGADKRFCVIQSNWIGGIVTSHRSGDGGHRSTSAGGQSKVHLAPVMEFTYSVFPAQTPVCSLLCGPVVLVTNRNRLSLFSLLSSSDSKSKSMMYRKDFCICDTDDHSAKQTADQKVNREGVNNGGINGDSESTVLYATSEDQWILTVLLMKQNRAKLEEKCCTFLVTIAFERCSENGEFSRHNLRTGDFLPEEYAPKASSLIMYHCQRMQEENGTIVYKNKCALGLNEGFVVLLADGVIQTCIMLWKHIGANYPAFAVTKLLKFGHDILICLTDASHCFIIDEVKQVRHHWEDVSEALVGDFLQRGGQQLLLLFSDDPCLSQGPPDRYLLTDLQGFIVDHRHPDGSGDESDDVDRSSSAEAGEFVFPRGDEKQRDRKQLQPAVDALLQQNQALSRRVAEEEQKLACKRQFVSHMWRRLQNLSLLGEEGATPNLSPPEVPLTTLIGVDPACNPPDRRLQGVSPLGPQVDIQVQSLWHRMLDGVCVVGVRIVNVSGRELWNCAVVLAPSITSTQSQEEVSTCTAVWQYYSTDSLPQEELVSQGSPRKRQKASSRVCVRRTKAVQHLESVLVTSVFNIAELGWRGKLAYHVRLLYRVREQRDSVGCFSQGVSVTASETVSVTSAKQANLENRATQRQDGGGVGRLKEAGRTKSVLCGEVVLNALELLHGEQVFRCLLEEEEGNCLDQSDPARLEAEVLTLNATQDRWLCHIDFGHHAGSVVSQSLRSAGFVFSSHLGQLWMCGAGVPRPLQFVRAEILGFAPYPQRVAIVLVCARDSNQLVLLLRHLYAHLPSSAIITTQTAPDPNPELLQHLVQLLSTQLCERRRLARTLLQSQNPALSNQGGSDSVTSESQPAPGTSTVRSEQSQKKKDEENICSPSESSESESEEFVEWQRILRQLQMRCVERKEVGRFRADLQQSEAETDMAFAKVKMW